MSKSMRDKAQGKSWYPAPALVRKRIAEMNRAFESSFPDRKFPNDRRGRKWARYMMRTKRLYPGPRDYLWLEQWCPWMDQSDRDRMLGSKGHWYSSSSLGQHLEVDNDMRKELELWTMRPNDVEWTQVQSERKERQYKKRQEKRRANGVKARRKDAAEPWKTLGMSKTTYYRKKLHLTGETPESPASTPVGTGDSHVSQAEAAAISLPAPSERRVTAPSREKLLLQGIEQSAFGPIRRKLMEQAQAMREQREAMPENAPEPPGNNVVPFSAKPTKPTHWHSGRPMGIYRKARLHPLADAA
jgi:hypothetical protein